MIPFVLIILEEGELRKVRVKSLICNNESLTLILVSDRLCDRHKILALLALYWYNFTRLMA